MAEPTEVYGGPLRGGCHARDPGHPESCAAGGGRDRALLPRVDARACSRARRGSRAPGKARGVSERRGVALPPHGAARRSSVWRAHPGARSQAARCARWRSTSSRVVRCRRTSRNDLANQLLRGGAHRAAHSGGADIGPRDDEVDIQFERGLMERSAPCSRAFPRRTTVGGLVYRQANRVAARAARDEAATRALIAQENRR